MFHFTRLKRSLPVLFCVYFLVSGCRQELPHHDGAMIDGGVAITFDDASINNWYKNLSLLDSLQIKATFYVSKYHTLSAEQKRKLISIQSHGHEIAYHTTNHGDLRKMMEKMGTDYVLENEILPDLKLMQADGFHITDFAFPFGSHNLELDNMLLKYFNSVRALANKNNCANALIFQQIRGQVFYGPDIDDTRQSWPDDNMVQKMIAQAYEKRASIIFTAHEIANPNFKLSVSRDRLIQIAKWVKENNLKFIRVNEISE